MTNTQAPAVDQPIYLDATAPLLEPLRLRSRLPDLVAGGVDVGLTTVGSLEDAGTTLRNVGQWLSLERSGDVPVRVCRTVRDIREAKAAGRVGVVMHFQGTDPIESDANLLDTFHACGVRVVQLTYNARNRVGDGCQESHDAGLSDFGRVVLHRLEDLAIVADVSHAGTRTALDVLSIATRPVVATHANARAICDSPRNLTDDVIRAIGESGGVIGLCAFPAFVSSKERPTLDDLLDHADHISSLIGPEHVGLGFDFAEEDEDDYLYFGYDERFYPHPPWTYPEGIGGYTEARNVGEKLRARGYSGQEVQGILGENFVRVFGEIWKA